MFCSFLPSLNNRHRLSTCICQLLLGIGWILHEPWPQDPVESDRQKNNCKMKCHVLFRDKRMWEFREDNYWADSGGGGRRGIAEQGLEFHRSRIMPEDRQTSAFWQGPGLSLFSLLQRKTQQVRGFIKEVYFSQFWRLKSPTSKCWQIWCLVKTHFLVHVLSWQKGQRSCLGSHLYKMCPYRALIWSCFILSGAISNCPLLFPRSILDTFQP